MRILIVDDHPLFSEGLKFLLPSLDENVQCDSVTNLFGALAALQLYPYDLLLLDYQLPDNNGLTSIPQIKQLSPDIPIVVVSGEDNIGLIVATIECGAMGFIPKSSKPEVLIHALRLVLSGGVYLPPRVLAGELEIAPPIDAVKIGLETLSTRQIAILHRMIQGKTNKSIANDLDLSEGTVKNHISTLLHMLGVKNRTEAVLMAARMGITVK